jgi:hypothetical protein
VRSFLIGCALLLLGVGCSGTTSSETSKKEQGSSPQAPESEEEARCDGTRTYHGPSFLTFRPKEPDIVYTTNDLPGCPNGGLLSGTDHPDQLGGKDGDDEIRGLGAEDYIYGDRARTSSTAGRATTPYHMAARARTSSLGKMALMS